MTRFKYESIPSVHLLAHITLTAITGMKSAGTEQEDGLGELFHGAEMIQQTPTASEQRGYRLSLMMRRTVTE